MAVASFMFRRPHHQRILRLLEVFNCAILGETGCWFAGGTAGVLMLDEYRESVNVDFLCASTDGYRRLRELVTEQGLGELLTGPVRYARRDMPVRADRYGIRTFIEIDGAAFKAEIVLEGRIALSGGAVAGLPVPVLSREDLFAEKLLANADRGADSSTLSRDIIDLGMMINTWGLIPPAAREKTRQAYGSSIERALDEAMVRIAKPGWRKKCLAAMAMDPSLGDVILAALNRQRAA